MQFNPGLNQAGLAARQGTGEQITTGNIKLRLMTLILCMDVWHVMLFSVKKIHADQDAVEAADGGHGRWSVDCGGGAHRWWAIRDSSIIAVTGIDFKRCRVWQGAGCRRIDRANAHSAHCWRALRVWH